MVKRIIQQHPCRVVAYNLGVFKHKLNAQTLVFNGRKIPYLVVAASEMKQHCRGFRSDLYFTLSRVALLAHLVQRLVLQQSQGLGHSLFYFRAEGIKKLFVKYLCEKLKRADWLFIELFYQV